MLYDSIIYMTSPENAEKVEFLVECDSSVTANLINHMKLYRVRKKIDLSVSDEHDIWCLQGDSKELSTNVRTFADPRVKSMGSRVITEKGADLKKQLGDVTEGSLDEYTMHRYKLGVGEGVIDHLPEKSLPLESNCDYLHGVSFHKGCYIGQELTARTHHTGVIRKRLMPLTFDKSISFKLGSEEAAADVKNEKGAAVGKIRNVVENIGLGLMRIEPALAAKEMNFNSNILTTHKPDWWPVEAEKSPQFPKK